MSKKDERIHPYIPNTVPEVKKKMLEIIGVEDIDELYATIPESLRFKGEMDLPEPLVSEHDLKRHVEDIISKNITCKEYLNFLGGVTWQHFVPAVCDEINQRTEFLTAYGGEPYEDHGRFQATFEYASMAGELVDMDVVSVPTYDWAQAAGTSIRMATRITDRYKALVPKTISPERLLTIKNYCKPNIKIELVEYDLSTGCMDLDDLRSKISPDIACVYLENPSFLGFIEDRGMEIANLIHDQGGLSIVGVDPSSLGILAPPTKYGADIICGELQPLGIHLHYGGGLAGFIATRDEEEYVMEYPLRLFGIAPTVEEEEYGFGDVAYERTSFAKREGGREFVGTMSALWGITAGVYLALLGPKGVQELGETIMKKCRYAMEKISEINGIKTPVFGSPHFKEFVVDFNNFDKSVEQINKALLEEKIFGGKDLSGDFPQLGNSALYCVTEIHSMQDIDKLVASLKGIL